MPRGSVSVICVEAWTGNVGARRFGAGPVQVLNDDGVGPGGRDGLEEFDGIRQLIRENQRVEGDVAADVVGVQEPHDRGSSSGVKLAARCRALNLGRPK